VSVGGISKEEKQREENKVPCEQQEEKLFLYKK
jgi:hypothetical protein